MMVRTLSNWVNARAAITVPGPVNAGHTSSAVGYVSRMFTLDGSRSLRSARSQDERVGRSSPERSNLPSSWAPVGRAVLGAELQRRSSHPKDEIGWASIGGPLPQ